MIHCPDCGYCPKEEITEPRQLKPGQWFPETWEEELDWFEVLGCLPGKIMCPKCACHFFPQKENHA